MSRHFFSADSDPLPFVQLVNSIPTPFARRFDLRLLDWRTMYRSFTRCIWQPQMSEILL